MFKKVRTITWGVAALVASLPVTAQSPAAVAAPRLLGAYESAFEGYRRFSADEVGDWRKANETVREVGGWRAYAREIHGAASAPRSAASAASSTPARVNPHQGHTQ